MRATPAHGRSPAARTAVRRHPLVDSGGSRSTRGHDLHSLRLPARNAIELLDHPRQERDGVRGRGEIRRRRNRDLVPEHQLHPACSQLDSELLAGTDPGNRLYFAGAGGTVYFRDNVDSSGSAGGGRLAFFDIANYAADPASYDTTVFINTPLTSDGAGNIFFGFRTSGTGPLGLISGIARIDASGRNQNSSHSLSVFPVW